MSQEVRQDFEQYLLALLRHRPAIHLPSAVRLHALGDASQQRVTVNELRS